LRKARSVVLSAEPGGLYQPRNPRATPLYRLFDSLFEEVRGQWEERFERRYGFWRGFVDEQVGRYLDCGLFENGFARVRCPDCHAEYLLAFSCKTRELCPSCAARRAAATAALLREEVLEEVGHAQWVFVIPKMLRPYFLHHRVRVEPEDGRAVERLARYIMRPPISLERIEWRGDGEVLYRPKGGHDGRSRHPGDPAEAFEPAEFLARVIMHVPEPRRHLVRYYGAYSNVSRGKRRRQDKATIGAGPRDSEHAPAARADRDQSPDARALRRSWAQLIKRVYEVDPLVCPSCGGEMRIIAFIIDHDVVDAILRHLAKAEARSPRGPPSAAALPAAS